MKFALKASGEKPKSKKTWSASSPHLPEMAPGMKLQWTKISQFEVHASMAVKWQKNEIQSTKLDIRWSENGSSASKLLKVVSWSFPATKFTKPQKIIWNKVKYHGYPKLPGSV